MGRLAPDDKKMLVGLWESSLGVPPTPKFSYDAQADWELSRLLSVLDEQVMKDAKANKTTGKLSEIRQLAETCAAVLQNQTESAEVFIQLAERILLIDDFDRFDILSDVLSARFSAAEIAEIVRQTSRAQIRAVAFETLAILPVSKILPLLDDPIYHEIAHITLEQQAFEFENEDAQMILEQLELGGMDDF